ncbi:MAG: hypothetical protein RMI43_00770 [Candidatus Caldarchaeum sp.]|nr:hypothetical protein [Candidatus Caldarchaeum sp.]MDW8062687.1 hypothetical protein [Candidatus Caldarchaeum sp.]
MDNSVAREKATRHRVTTAHEMDFRKCLDMQVGKAGEINTEYGGFAITVREPTAFPWSECLAALLEHGYEVWVTKKKENLVIVAKPAGD